MNDAATSRHEWAPGAPTPVEGRPQNDRLRWPAVLLLRPGLPIAVALGALGILIAATLRPGPDFEVYVASGEAVLGGKDIYLAPLPAVNTGPPFFSLFCVAPALLERLSPALARAVWTLGGLAALLCILRTGARLVYGRAVPITSPRILIPLALALTYVLSTFLYHQVNLFVFALALGGMALQEDRKEFSGGALVGAAAALKVMPVLFIPYLLYRRRWRAGASAVAVAAALTASPCLVLGWEGFVQDFAYWWRMLPHQACWDAGQRNQSVLAMWDRILGHGYLPFLSPGVPHTKMTGSPWVRLAWVGTAAFLGMLALAAFRGRPERASPAALAEWGVIFVASAILGPVTWRHYFVIFLLPNILLYRLWREAREQETRRWAGALFGGAFFLAAAAARFPFGDDWCQRMGTGSNLTLAALLMIGGLLRIRRLTAGLRPDQEALPPVPG